MSNTHSKFAAALLCGTALSGVLAPAFAQTAPGKDAVETVIVTAQRRSQDILSVPYNISSVSGQRIEQLQIRDNAELLRSIPGVGIIDRGDRSGGVVNSIRIRGLNVDSSALGDYAVSAAATVSTYVDDTPIFANFALKDIDHVEVLKGPQGTLYGSGALGGTVRYIMNQPSLDGFEGSASSSISQSHGSGGFDANEDIVLNVPLSDELAFRVSGSYYNNAGITDYVNIYKLDATGTPVLPPGGLFSNDAVLENKKDADWYRGWFGRAALLWKPTANFDLTLTLMDQSDRYGGRRAQALGDNGFGRPYQRFEAGSMILEPGNRDTTLVSAEANLDLGFATLTSSTSYYNNRGDIVSDNTGFYAQNNWWATYYYNYPRPIAHEDRLYGDKAFVQELRLVSHEGGPIDYTIGAFYENQLLHSTQFSLISGFNNWCAAAGCFLDVVDDNDYDFRRHERSTEVAGYGEVTWHATDALQFTGGVRVFHDTDNTQIHQMLNVYALFRSTTDSSGPKFDTTRVLFKANGSWKFNDDGMLYATVSQGYRRGGSNGIPTTGFFPESPAWETFKPDHVTNYEIGAKGKINDNWVYNADVFFVRWKDAQLNTGTTFFGYIAVQNANLASTKGLEAQIDNYSGNWHTSLGYTYTDAKLSEKLTPPDFPNLNPPFNVAGAPLPGAPKHVVTGSVDYTQPFDNDTNLFLHLDGYYQSMTQDSATSAARAINTIDYPGQPKFYAPMDGYALFNASATYTFGDWAATAYVKNIFDAEAIQGIYTEAYMGTSPRQNYYGNASKAIYVLPRTVGVTLKLKF